ncbi:Cu-Zn family superoxide dismutase [Halopolyspora algeriensis]|uniref:Cu-Zn family superoxide dismutase n=1 Tax=Halopolyspora algeriensis TaxID=1500506 RepID=A0A368W1D6_9ACTN|nr:superoxide dismutase family protein [Halopolyspora algeriensis]RCW47024.1 Cu-Zn family superoxide dismutase [Halopolyspora algeriensis]TQM48111.1 Cu-Zn family superoxide dismutase [Halopolyspora algeriensis]
MPRISTAAIAATFAAMTVTAPAVSAAPGVSAQAGDHVPRISAGTFGAYSEDAVAVTYDTDQVPAGAKARVVSTPIPGGHTSVIMALRGLQPNSSYGAHVHTRPCGPTGSDAGPHFQQVEAPEGVSGDPDYANPDNEVWLDFRTDSDGEAVSAAFGDWQLREREANSIVIHENLTKTAPGVAGEAGPRLACINVRF